MVSVLEPRSSETFAPNPALEPTATPSACLASVRFAHVGAAQLDRWGATRMGTFALQVRRAAASHGAHRIRLSRKEARTVLRAARFASWRHHGPQFVHGLE